MRVKTSITLSEETLKTVDRLAGKSSNRSRVIEQAIEAYSAAQARSARDARDLETINRQAEALNRELADALTFQGEP
jgi:predicted transcriptional regulator